MHSTEIEIRREKQAQAVTRNYDSILHLIYAIVSIIFVAYLIYFVFDGLLNSDYSYTDLAKAAKVNQDSDSIFLSMFLVIPFAIWRTLKSVSGLVLYFTGRKAAKNGTKISKTGISFFGSFSSGESITLITVLALGGFYTILMGYSFYSAIDKKTKEALYSPVESFLPFAIFVIVMALAVVAVMFIKTSAATMLLILQNKDTYKKISPIPAYISFAVAVIAVAIPFIFNPSYNSITGAIVEKKDRLVTLVNMVYDEGSLTIPFIILLVLFVAKYAVSGLCYFKASKAGISDSISTSLDKVA